MGMPNISLKNLFNVLKNITMNTITINGNSTQVKGSYEPKNRDIEIINQRINERLNGTQSTK